VLDCLRRLDTGALATAELMQRFSLVSYGNSVLPLEPRRALEAGRFHRVPVIQGTNQDEMRLFLAQTLAGYPIPDGAAYRDRLERSFDPPTARVVAAAYPVSAFATPAMAWATVLTDVSFVCPTLRDGAALGRYVPVYTYRFSDRGAPDFTGLPAPPDLPYGATHGFELPYLFTLAPLTGPQRQLADRMTGYWTGFARTGVPAAPGAPRWPRERTAAPVLSLAPGAGGIRTVDARAEHHCALWDARWPGVTRAR
ncbi:carboxylesterase family protein, partial [Streptomyces sp. NPDC054840]